MQKPTGFDNVTTGTYTPISEGGHHLIIKGVEETTSKSGKAMLKVYFDTATTDREPGFYMKEFQADIRPDKKWPHGGTQYIVIEDAKGNCTKSFKGFITCFEKSNNCETIWSENGDAKFRTQFMNKTIGGVFGKVENEYNGKVTMRTELRWFCEDSKVDTVATPSPKYLDKPNNDGFVSLGDAIAETLPF